MEAKDVRRHGHLAGHLVEEVVMSSLGLRFQVMGARRSHDLRHP